MSEKHAAAIRESWANPEIRERRTASIRATMSTPEYQAKHRAGVIRYWDNSGKRVAPKPPEPSSVKWRIVGGEFVAFPA